MTLTEILYVLLIVVVGVETGTRIARMRLYAESMDQRIRFLEHELKKHRRWLEDVSARDNQPRKG